MTSGGYQIRPATPADEPFLWEMLYQSLYVEEGAAPFSREVLRRPELSRYVEGWGRAGDLGFVAEEAGSGSPVGAAWSRLPEGVEKGFAYVDAETPELAVAVSKGHRGRGVGTALMKRLLSEASALFPAVSLSVSPENPARRLYERLGFETLGARGGHPLMLMRFGPSGVPRTTRRASLNMLTVRRAEESDFDPIWRIFREVAAGGDTFTFDEGTTREQARAFWLESEGGQTYVALLGAEVVGAYIIKPNQPGHGSHVANAAYMVDPGRRGLGVGRTMCAHSLEEARAAGFLAMQFNIVVSTNEAAVGLWKKMGFAVVGTLPKAFRHREQGLVDAFVMHRFL